MAGNKHGKLQLGTSIISVLRANGKLIPTTPPLTADGDADLVASVRRIAQQRIVRFDSIGPGFRRRLNNG